MKLTLLRIILIIGALFVLLMMLSYPFGPDQSVASVGGEMSIRHGAIAYKDFMDTKPQLIFWIYGIATYIFGHNTWSIRLFDIIYHIFTLYIFYHILRYFTKNENVAFTSIILYVIFYVASGFDNTAEAETFALLPSILLFYYTEKAVINESSSLKAGILAGIFGGILFLLKFTFWVTGLTAVLYLVINRSVDRRTIIRYCLGFALSILIIAGLYLLYLFESGSLPRFLEAMRWLQAYSKGSYGVAPNATPGGTHFKMYPGGLLLEYGLTFIILLCIAILLNVRNKSGLSQSYSHLCLQVLTGIIIVYYEGKSWNYHFARFSFAAIPLIALGFENVILELKEIISKWKGIHFFQSLIRYAILIPTFALAIFYSPLMRIWKFPVRLTIMRLKDENIDQEIQNDLTGYYYKEQTSTSDFLRPLLAPNDQIFLWGRGVGLYFDLNRLPTTICLTSMSMSTPHYTPISWQQSVLKSLEKEPPRFIITQADMNTDYMAAQGASLELNENRPLEEWPELYNFVQADYTEIKKFGHFTILEKK